MHKQYNNHKFISVEEIQTALGTKNEINITLANTFDRLLERKASHVTSNQLQKTGYAQYAVEDISDLYFDITENNPYYSQPAVTFKNPVTFEQDVLYGRYIFRCFNDKIINMFNYIPCLTNYEKNSVYNIIPVIQNIDKKTGTPVNVEPHMLTGTFRWKLVGVLVKFND